MLKLPPPSQQRILLICFLIVATIVTFPNRAIGQENNFMVKIRYDGRSYIGQPLAWTGKELMLLRREGKMSMIPMTKQEELEKVSDTFIPYSFSKLQTRLRSEFGSKYQVTRTENFLVVHPPGDADVWAQPFQDLYRRFTVYFSSRGATIAEPEFPMVAVVLRTRKEFDRFLVDYHQYDPNILGYYSMTSNRIITYDQSQESGASRSDASLANNSTLIHEATHQTAFNTGIHSRFAPQLRWATEGLAMLFEARGVNNSTYYSTQKDRINRDRLLALQRHYRRNETKNVLAQLVVNDDLFRTNPQLAYDYSWGLTFFLSEKMPGRYLKFLQQDSKREPFQEHSSNNRSSQFAAAFGSDLDGLEARMKQFIESLDAD